jgi:hypothetical protein
VFRAEASTTNASTWVVGCPAGSLGLLASIVAAWESVDGCEWVVWCMCVVWTVASVVVRT